MHKPVQYGQHILSYPQVEIDKCRHVPAVSPPQYLMTNYHTPHR